MKITLNNTLKKEIIYPIVVGLILIIIEKIYPGFFNFIGLGIKKAWQFMILDISIPIYLLILLILFTSLNLIPLIKFILHKKKLGSIPSFISFNSLVFQGVKWKWNYSNHDDSWSIGEVTGYCPICMTRLITNSLIHNRSVHVEFFCDNCEKRQGFFEGTEDLAIDRVKREIERLIDTEKWKLLL